jgi:hypothetical protein
MHDAKVGHILVRKRLLHEIVFDKLQFVGLMRMNINEKINGIINVQLMIINVQNKARSA